MKKKINIFERIKNFISNSIKFITYDIWHLGSEKLNKRDAFFVKQLKVILIALRSFVDDKISVRASALTYYTMMSIIPLAALVFAIAKGFNLDTQLKTQILNNFGDQQELLGKFFHFVDSTLQNTKGGVIAGVGVCLLLWSCLRLMIHIEQSLNQVWNVKRPRSWKNRIGNYLSVLIIAPIFLVISSSVSLTVNHKMNGLISSYSFFNSISPVLTFLYECIPFVSVWMLFTLLYKFMPNTRVKLSHAMLAAIIAGSLFQLMQNLYVYSQVTITKFSAIYGTFAAIPLFMIWAQMSWIIVLLGGELAFAYQNIDIYEQEKESEHTSFMQRKIVALLVARLIAINFKNGDLPMDVPEISEKLMLPTRIVRVVINNLVDADLISEVVSSDDKELAYQPAFDIHDLTIASVFVRLESLGRSDFISKDNEDYSGITELLESIEKDFVHSSNNKLLIDL